MSRIGVVFDIDHTLIIDNKLERVAFLHLIARTIEDGGHELGTLAQEIAAIDALLKAQRAGAFTIDEAVGRFIREHGAIPKASDAEFFRAMVLAMVDDFVVADPEAAPTIAALTARGYALGVLSNGWNPLQERKARRAGFAGLVMASGDLGCQKPDPRAFHAIASAMGLDPSCVWYVGDDPRADIAGALAAGLQAVWIDNEAIPYPADAPAPTHRIGSLGELLAILPAPIPAA